MRHALVALVLCRYGCHYYMYVLLRNLYFGVLCQVIQCSPGVRPQACVVIPMLYITIADVPLGERLNVGCVHAVVLLLYT